MVSGGPLLQPGEQAAAQSRLGLVLAATARMGDSLDLRAVAQALAETVVPQFADCATVELVEDILRPGGAGLNASPMLQVALAGTPVEGVASDAHMVPLALGTQTTGSTTRPASFCGVVGYRLTRTWLPRHSSCFARMELLRPPQAATCPT